MRAAAFGVAAFITVGCMAPSPLVAQERGTAALGSLVASLRPAPRVLVIAAHPDDEDTGLITLLARGQGADVAYLSLTRGDGGQNLIGNELGDGLGVIRSEELLAARRVDGGRQYFTRAYDFGFSKSAEETFRHWPRDEVLRDVVTTVRAFRPDVIVSVFSGTPRDGHGHHQVAGLLAREAYDLAADTVRFPRATTAGHGAWRVSKFYRSSRFNREQATLAINVGAFSPLVGRSYAEMAGESRSQHKSQGFGVLQRKGPQFTWVRREASRVNEGVAPAAERSLLDGIDTSWTGLAVACGGAQSPVFNRASSAIADVRSRFSAFDPSLMIEPLARALTATRGLSCSGAPGATVAELSRRLEEALVLAAGVAVEAESRRPTTGINDPFVSEIAVYNRGRTPIRAGLGRRAGVTVAPDSVVRWQDTAVVEVVSRPWWLARQRSGDLFAVPVPGVDDASLSRGIEHPIWAEIAGVRVPVRGADVLYRVADPVRGDISMPVAAVPAVSVLLDRGTEYVRAGEPVQREVRVRLRSGSVSMQSVVVRLAVPRGLVADSAARTVMLAAGADAEAMFSVRGIVVVGEHRLVATATAEGREYATGYQRIAYGHIRPQHLYRDAVMVLRAVDVRVPPGASIAYLTGVGDNVAPTLRQLGVLVTELDIAALGSTDLRGFTAVVVGPRAFEAHPALRRHNARLLAYARGGGTLVVQYQQMEISEPGMAPKPITVSRPAQRVTLEEAPIALCDANAQALRAPNRIGAADFDGWVQERALYMPSAFDTAYSAPLETHDPGEPENRGALLVLPYGDGTYVYTTLSFFRQLPAGVPGAARLFINLISMTKPRVGA